jgi:hypothetical protein
MKTLVRRLRRLEDQLRPGIAPAVEQMIAQIVYVSPDGSEEDGPRYELSAVPAPAWQRKQALTIANEMVRRRSPVAVTGPGVPGGRIA